MSRYIEELVKIFGDKIPANVVGRILEVSLYTPDTTNEYHKRMQALLDYERKKASLDKDCLALATTIATALEMDQDDILEMTPIIEAWKQKIEDGYR